MASNNSLTESAISFACGSEVLFGILHRPIGAPKAGVVIVVGGPQYRVGSHRLFVSLARYLSAKGFAVLRFDCRGMGDSTGDPPGFEMIGPDIAAAVSTLRREIPALTCVALWGLCDGASAICMYAAKDPSIAGIAMVNPWARTDRGRARAQLRHYYWRRIRDAASWHRMITGASNPWPAVRSFCKQIGVAIRPIRKVSAPDASDLPERMARGVRNFAGKILIILSENDLTAREFDAAIGGSEPWRDLLAANRVLRRELPDSDHTFSRSKRFEQVAVWTADWLNQTSELDRQRCSPS